MQDKIYKSLYTLHLHQHKSLVFSASNNLYEKITLILACSDTFTHVSCQKSGTCSCTEKGQADNHSSKTAKINAEEWCDLKESEYEPGSCTLKKL